MSRKRSPAEKAAHAKDERDRYALLKRGLKRAIALKMGSATPSCMVEAEGVRCGRVDGLEIDHVHFTRFKQRNLNSVQRLERFAIEFIKWVGGDRRYRLRLACRMHNARHQPKKRVP